MKAVITVTGTDKVGIIAGVSGLLSEMGVNIVDISQTVMGDYFAMFMLVEVSKDNGVVAVSERLKEVGEKLGVSIVMQHEDVYKAMHRV